MTLNIYLIIKNFFFFLNKIKKNKKKILVCLHPKAKYPTKILKLLKSNFIIKFGTKDAYIHSSEFVIISMSSRKIYNIL